MNKRIYISGKITGLAQVEYLRNFMQAEMELSKEGWSVVNPAKVNAMMPLDTDYDTYMDMSFAMLKSCNAIYMMKNWVNSKGAKSELEKAKEIGLEVIYG